MNESKTAFRHITVVLQLALLIFVSALIVRAAGELDLSLAASAYDNAGETVYATVIQPDGKILVGGNFSVVKGVARGGIARLNVDGTVDTTFSPPDLFDFTNNRLGGIVNGIGIQSNGKIVVGGKFTVIGSTYKDLLRLNADGSIDPTFANLSAQFDNDSFINDVIIASNDSVYIGGRFTLNAGGSTRTYGIGKLTADGNVDLSFLFPPVGSPIREIALQPDGKVIASDTNLLRTVTNGDPDNSFTTITSNGAIDRIIIQPDGKILIGGTFTQVNGFSQSRISRININGSVDTTFNLGGAGANNSVSDIIVGAGGAIYVAGNFTTFNGVATRYIVKLDANGMVDNTFNSPLTAASGGVRSVDVQADGKILITDLTNTQIRLNPNGTIDSSFMQSFYGKGGIVNDVIQQPDGKILAGGQFIYANNVKRFNLARYNTDGSVDTTFNVPSYLMPGNFNVINKLALQPDEKILVVGAISGGIIRLNTDGSRDTSFTANTGSALSGFYDVEVLADGKILVNGIRLLSNGMIDNTYTVPTFGGFNEYIKTTYVQPDGKILIGGTFTQVNGVARGRIARLNADGTLDTSFIAPLGANNVVDDIDLQQDGKIIVVGTFDGLNGDSTRKYVGRLNGDGTLDTTFAPVVNSYIHSVKIQANGKILLGGFFTIVNGISRNRYARLNPDGSLDVTFNISTGANDVVNRINLQTDGKILLGGNFTRINNFSAVGIARLLNAPATTRTRFDFDGDGRADISVFRPSNGYWYELRSQNGAFSAQLFGQSNDRIAPADYDGDGRADVAVFRDVVPGAGNFAYFYITNSSDNSFRYEQFGATGDVPVTGDWDGDGRADLAVYRDGSLTGGQSYFFYRPSSQSGVNFRQISWGATGDKPLYGDFDGDGKLDAAIFRPSIARFYILRSSDNQVIEQPFGISSDIPVPADYDGDGITNIAVFRPSTGYWYTSTNPAINYGAVQFGQSGDLPVPADYDGDGKADVAVFRPATGAWYLLRSTQGFTGVGFGQNDDKPIPNAYIR